ncbi:hypothetical protein BN1723_011401 [Verticillium longisporum]|uniref:FAD-binding FR-type domain-containing protein n=1 Tax=Verticillium longisporum TaxID=100787 RepID=A0A0G4L788_VERLO|nr:hypothetical protein BN1723_011401 [Verticillium longisporum]
MRVMKRGNIAECYLDNIAVRLESIRLGKRQGYRRFLVFAELTKSKKGGQYIALFTYFSFQSWIRVLLCSGPRQAINALTLKSVYEVKLSSAGDGNVGEEILSFFEKIKELATQDTRQAVILSGMLFTLVVWIFSALFLLAAVLFYVFFLWHWIPRADGGLSGYCERKVNKSLTKIVHEKVDKALAKEERKQLKAGINGGAAALPSTPLATATLQHRQPLTPSITRFTFALDAPHEPVPGEYVTLDFAAELDHGWSHMRDDDPRSLNEDWIRSFTVSGSPSARAFEITARVKRGGATELLAKHLLRGGPLEVAVRGFAVTEGTRMGAVAEGGEKKEVFVAGGVGITPLLAQAPGLLEDGKAFEVIWGVRGEDVGVVRDAVERIPGLAARLRVHVTGKIGEADEETLAKIEALGVGVERRRMEKQDLERVFEGEKRKFYLCAAPALLTIMKGWLENEEVVWEDFGY